MIATTRVGWATAKQRLRVEEAAKDCDSIFASLHEGDVTVAEAGALLVMAVREAGDDLDQLNAFIAREATSA